MDCVADRKSRPSRAAKCMLRTVSFCKSCSVLRTSDFFGSSSTTSVLYAIVASRAVGNGTSIVRHHGNSSAMTEAGLFKWMDNLAKFGISFASGVPPTEAASEALCLKLGVLRNTNYSSGMWTLQPNMSKEDTAYSHAALKAHTDNTYYTDPCGLQVLHCIGFDGQLGHNIFVDGFNAASQLMLTHPGHLAVLSKTRVPFQWVDKNEQFYAAAPIITLNPYTGEPFQIRQNNDDRAPLLVSPHAQRSFYYALHAWYSLLRDPRHEFKTILRPGTLVAFDNHRVLHGRESFTGNRTVVGCYIGRDEFRSRYRSLRDANAAKPSGAKQA